IKSCSTAVDPSYEQTVKTWSKRIPVTISLPTGPLSAFLHTPLFFSLLGRRGPRFRSRRLTAPSLILQRRTAARFLARKGRDRTRLGEGATPPGLLPSHPARPLCPHLSRAGLSCDAWNHGWCRRASRRPAVSRSCAGPSYSRTPRPWTI